jgi:hypothetical protein
MHALLAWLSGNWSSVLQTLGMFIGFWFTAKTLQLGNLLTMSEQRAALWQRAQEEPQLRRIWLHDIDVSEPPTLAEREFLITAIILFQNGWRVAKTFDQEELRTLALDLGDIFSLPLPRAVWEKTKKFRNQRFVRFVERAMDKATHKG